MKRDTFLPLLGVSGLGAVWYRPVRTRTVDPVLLPPPFVGLREGVSLALVIVVVAEMFIGSTDGLGQRVFEAQQLFAMPDMYAAIFAVGALGYGLNLLFIFTEKRYLHWSGR